MSLKQADELWFSIRNDLLDTIAGNRALHAEWKSLENSPFGYKGYKPENNIHMVYSYMCNRVANIISNLPREVNEFLAIRGQNSLGVNPFSLESLVAIFVKDYDEIFKRLQSEPTINAPMTSFELASILQRESSSILETFQHYNALYETSLREGEEKTRAEQNAVVRIPSEMAATTGQQDTFIEFEILRNFIRRVDLNSMSSEEATKLWGEITKEALLHKRANPQIFTKFQIASIPNFQAYHFGKGGMGYLLHRYSISLVWYLISEAIGYQSQIMPTCGSPSPDKADISRVINAAIQNYTTQYNHLKKNDVLPTIAVASIQIREDLDLIQRIYAHYANAEQTANSRPAFRHN